MVDLDAVIPEAKVIETARAFLERCGFRLEIDDGKLITIPRTIELILWTRAFIEDKVQDSDHYKASVMLGRLEGSNSPDLGYLVLYFDLDGHFFTEDRYPRYCGQYDQARWEPLAREVSEEKDVNKLRVLVRELDMLLEEQKRKPSAVENGAKLS